METLLEAVETAINAENTNIEYHEKQLAYHSEYHTKAKEESEQRKATLIRELSLLKELLDEVPA
ncbi:hypothetical protein [Mucilaginibacter xinganensis]|nr:hypothetical protein [Mucilaginibacter xinganensis]